MRGPKTFSIQKLPPSILVRVTQSIQKVSQTAFLIRRSWDRCWISLPSKLRVLLPFYIPWEAIDGHSFHKNHDKTISVEFISYYDSLGKVWSLQDASSWPYQYTFQIPKSTSHCQSRGLHAKLGTSPVQSFVQRQSTKL